MIYLTFSIHHFVPCEPFSVETETTSAVDSLTEWTRHQRVNHKLTKVSREAPHTLSPHDMSATSGQFISHKSISLECPLVCPKNVTSRHSLAHHKQMSFPLQLLTSHHVMRVNLLNYLLSNFLAFGLLKVFSLPSTPWPTRHSQLPPLPLFTLVYSDEDYASQRSLEWLLNFGRSNQQSHEKKTIHQHYRSSVVCLVPRAKHLLAMKGTEKSEKSANTLFPCEEGI